MTIQQVYNAIAKTWNTVYNYTSDIALKVDKSGSIITGLMQGAMSSSIASATTTDLSTATGNVTHITGTTTITAFGTVTAGTEIDLIFDDALTLTYNATTLILPTASNIVTVAGDTVRAISEGSGNWRLTNYQRASGASLSGSTSLAARGTVADGAYLEHAHNLGTTNPLVIGSYLEDNLTGQSVAKPIENFDLDVKLSTVSTVFESGISANIAGFKLSNNNAVISYTDSGDSSKAKFTIYDSSGTLVVAPTLFEDSVTTMTDITSLDYTGRFATISDKASSACWISVWNNAGTASVAQVLVNATASPYMRCCTINKNTANEQIVVICRDGSSDNTSLKFWIMNTDLTFDHGAASAGIVIDNTYRGTDVAPFRADPDKFIVVYQGENGIAKVLRAVVYNSDGTVYKAITTLTPSITLNNISAIRVSVSNDDIATITLANNGNSGEGQVISVDKDLNIVCPPTISGGMNTTVAEQDISYLGPETIVAWKASGDGNIGKFRVRGSVGGITKGIEMYFSGNDSVGEPVIISMADGYFMIAYANASASNGQFKIYRKLYYATKVIDSNTVRLYNYTGKSRNLALLSK